MHKHVQEFLDFVRRSPTAFHAVDALCAGLRQSGFSPLRERDPWQLTPGGRYYVTRNGSSVIAFTLPDQPLTHFQIVASHSDSPMFKLKPRAEEEAAGHYVRLHVERYGGMIFSTWLDRPLSIAGRVLVRQGDVISSRLVDLARDAVLIPNVPIHFNRQMNSGYAYNPQVDLLPLYGDETAMGRFAADIAQACGVAPDAIVGEDLYLYNRMPGAIWGADDAFFSSARIDDLECAFTSFKAFTAARPARHANVFAVLDNEEVGSSTRQGANSTFLGDVLFRACASLGLSDAQSRAAASASFMASADNAHAVHPNHAELYDPLNRTCMNGGVVIKHSASQSYATDGVSDALFSAICARAGVPVQHFANRSDMPGGSTLGNIANTQLSMTTVDIGLAQLAMHSSYETAGVKDVGYMVDALRAFYETTVLMQDDGQYAFV